MITTLETTLGEVERYLSQYGSQQVTSIRCSECKEPVGKTKRQVLRMLSEYRNPNKNRKTMLFFCGRRCSGLFYRPENKVYADCGTCGAAIVRNRSEALSDPLFCSQSCAATYNNRNKTTGIRRSKVEEWLESKLDLLYPDLEVVYNGTAAIGAELDIYIPSRSLAFEIDGIFHFEPIYGEEKLAAIQRNDKLKEERCLEKEIELHRVDISKMTHFSLSAAKEFLNSIADVLLEDA